MRLLLTVGLLVTSCAPRNAEELRANIVETETKHAYCYMPRGYPSSIACVPKLPEERFLRFTPESGDLK